MALRPLGPLFDPELSDDEARELFRLRKASGTSDEVMFMAQREVVMHLGKQNGNIERMQDSITSHLKNHPANEVVAIHLEDAHDDTVRWSFVRKVGGAGNAILLVGGSLLGTVILVLQVMDMVRGG